MAGRSKRKRKKQLNTVVFVAALVAMAVAAGVYYLVTKQPTDSEGRRTYKGDLSEGFKCWRGRWVLRKRTIGNRKGVALRLRKSCRLRLINCTVNGRVILYNGAQLVVEGGRIQGERSAVSAYHGTQLVLTSNGALSGRTAIKAYGRAQVRLESGIVHGTTAIYATNRSSVVIDPSVDVRGRISKHSRAVVTRVEKGADPQQALRSEQIAQQARARYKKDACPGVVSCFQQSGFDGQISGEVTFEIDKHGAVRAVRPRIDRGGSAQVNACLIALGKRKRVRRFVGPAGRLICTFSGSITARTRVVDQRGRYEIANEAPRAADKSADKPDDMPDKPADKPVEKSADKPAEKP